MAAPLPARYCPCGTRLARDNAGAQCAACQRKRQRALTHEPPMLPTGFWDDERLREALGNWHMGQVIYAYRVHSHHGRALSQEVVANWLGLTQAQLSRIESGPAPQDLGKLTSWAHSLRVPASLLWFKLRSAQQQSADRGCAVTSDRSQRDQGGGLLLPVLIDGHSVMVPVDARTLRDSGLAELLNQRQNVPESEAMRSFDRRTLLKGGVVAAALPGLCLEEVQRVASTAGDARRHMDGPVIEYLRRQIALCKRDDGSLGPKKTLPVMLGLLGAVQEHARDVRPDVRRELLSVGADGAEFAGWLYRDIHRPGPAGFWYDRAMEWAQEANDSAMQGYVLLKKSQMTYDDRDAVRVRTLAEAAGRQQWRLPPKARAEVVQQEALGLAMTGEPLDAVRQKLDEAQDLMAKVSTGEPAMLGAYFTENTRLLRDAVIYTEAGKPGKAVELFNGAIAAGSLSPRDTGFFNARRAAAVALCGEPDEAALLGRQSAQIAHALKSERTLRVLSEVLQTLGRWGSRPAVRDFRDALGAT